MLSKRKEAVQDETTNIQKYIRKMETTDVSLVNTSRNPRKKRSKERNHHGRTAPQYDH